MNLSPNEMLRHLDQLEDSLDKLNKRDVAVGVTQDTATSKIYESGINVLENATFHEFGTSTIPKRSFLRVPFLEKAKDINGFIEKQYKRILEEGASVDDSLGLIGVFAQNISKEAFTTKGYGKWPDIKQSTKNAKGSSAPLIDTGSLRRAVTYEVRDKE